MSFWEITLNRAQITLAIWKTHAPDLKVRGVSMGELDALVGQFEGLAQAQTQAEDELKARKHTENLLHATLREQNLRVPRLIEAELPDHAELTAGCRHLQTIPLISREKMLTRGRGLLPVWQMANTALAALPQPRPPIVCRIRGVEHTAEMLAGLLQEFNEQARLLGVARANLAVAKTALRLLDRDTGRINKSWYKIMTNTFEKGEPAREALARVPVMPGAVMPATLALRPLKQGGLEGRQALVTYNARGGERATRLLLHWGAWEQDEAVDDDAPLPHSMPLNRAGDALGPFPVGTVVRARVEAANSAGSMLSSMMKLKISNLKYVFRHQNP